MGIVIGKLESPREIVPSCIVVGEPIFIEGGNGEFIFKENPNIKPEIIDFNDLDTYIPNNRKY